MQAAGTKWNFLPFRPGLVGGHCIGVDPYYLTHKAQEIGYHPEMILAGRRINDNMALYVAERVAQLMIAQAHPREGLAHPGDGPDVQGELPGPAQLEGRRRRHASCRSTARRSTSTIRGSTPRKREHEYGIKPIRKPAKGRYDAVVLAVAHKEFRDMGIDAIRALRAQAARALRHQVPVRCQRGRRTSLASDRRRASASVRSQSGRPNPPNQALERASDFCYIRKRRVSAAEQLFPGGYDQLRLQLRQRAARCLQTMYEFASTPAGRACSDAAWDRQRCAPQFPDEPERLVAGQLPRRRVHFGGQRNRVAPRGQVFMSGRHGDLRAEAGPAGCR